MQGEDGREGEIAWQGHIIAPGATVWATPLGQSDPYFVVDPLLGQGATSAQVLHSVRGPRLLATA